jgi:hypothetical protein
MNTDNSSPFGLQLRTGPSRVNSIGVFTSGPVEAGRPVLVCGGRRVHRDEVPDGLRSMQVTTDEYLVEDPDHPSIDDFLNHSCEPNLGFTSGTLVLYALRPIAAGEELTFDYSTSMCEPGWSFPCRCGAPTCRGVVRSFCDLDEGERSRLLPIALAYLRPAPAGVRG